MDEITTAMTQNSKSAEEITNSIKQVNARLQEISASAEEVTGKVQIIRETRACSRKSLRGTKYEGASRTLFSFIPPCDVSATPRS